MKANNAEASAALAFQRFIETVAKLRHPEKGCPWDLQQTHDTLRRYMIEEAYEAAVTMKKPDFPKMREELGDVLLQVVLNSQLAAEAKQFSVREVIDGINEKMIRRHPHVFESAPSDVKTDKDVRRQWEEIMKKEKGEDAKGGLFAEAEKEVFPSLLQAYKIGKIAQRVDFDWDRPQEVLAQLKSEVAELEKEMAAASQDAGRIEDELSDVIFTVAQLCRHFNLDPEVVAQSGNQKFLTRFRKVEELASAQKIDLTGADRAVKERLWTEAKKAK